MAAGNYSAGPGGGRAPTARPHPYRQRGGRLSDLSAGAGLRIRIGGERRRSCRGRRGGNIERAGRLCGGTARCGTQDIAHRRRRDAAGYAHGLSQDGGGAYGAAEMKKCVKKEMERANTINDEKNKKKKVYRFYLIISCGWYFVFILFQRGRRGCACDMAASYLGQAMGSSNAMVALMCYGRFCIRCFLWRICTVVSLSSISSSKYTFAHPESMVVGSCSHYCIFFFVFCGRCVARGNRGFCSSAQPPQ